MKFVDRSKNAPSLREAMHPLLLLTTLLIPAAGHAQSVSPERLPTDFVAAWNAHSVAAFEKLYTADATWVPSSEERTEGRASILREFSAAHDGKGWAVARKVTIAVKGLPKVQMLRPDVATIFFHMNFLVDGKIDPAQLRTLILVADKSNDGWRIAAGQLTKQATFTAQPSTTAK
jgi:uncharacterized protein (TIGR02246 family)